MSSRKETIEKYRKQVHNRMLKQYNLKHYEIERLLRGVDFSKLYLANIAPNEIIKLTHHTLLNRQIEGVRKQFQERLNHIILSSMRSQWLTAHRQLDALFRAVYPNVPPSLNGSLYSRDVAVWNGLRNRQLFEGRTLSGRIWKLSHQYKRDIVDTLQIGLASGDNVRQLAMRLERYTRDANEKLIDINKLTNKEIHSEMMRRENRRRRQGSMGSTYKDAKRLAGNETNIAYREATQSRYWNPEILGFRIHLSNAHPRHDICDNLVGDYPTWFKWNGWHPNCLCYTTTILMDEKDSLEYRKALARRETPTRKGVVDDVPEGFRRYMIDNYERMSNWNSQPYFMQDNNLPEILGWE